MKLVAWFILIAFLYIAVFDVIILNGWIESSVTNVMFINEGYNALCALMAMIAVRHYKIGTVAFLSAFSLLFLSSWNILSMLDCIPEETYTGNIRTICNYGLILTLGILTFKKITGRE